MVLFSCNDMKGSQCGCLFYLNDPSKMVHRSTEKWNKAINSKRKIQKERDIIVSEIKGKYQQMYLNGEITKAERFQMCSDEANRLFAERFGLEYGKEAN